MISLLIFSLLSPTLGVSIDRVQVPPVVEEGEESVILDCPFSFNYDEEENLELKWYFNDSPSPFYQWIPGTRGVGEVSEPQVIGEMWRQKTDLNWTKYEDGARRHRALLLSRPSVHMSGLYRCKVSSLTSEAEAQARMLVYSPVDEMEFTQRTLTGSHVNVSCKVNQICFASDQHFKVLS